MNKTICALLCFSCLGIGIFAGMQVHTDTIVVYGVTPKTLADLKTVERRLYVNGRPGFGQGPSTAQKTFAVGETDNLKKVADHFEK